MFAFIEKFAYFITIKLGLDINDNLGKAVSFFIEDFIKIFLLIYLTLFIVSLFRYQLEPEKIREYLQGKKLNLRATQDKHDAYEGASFVIIATPTDYDLKSTYY
jgi:uncharacterized membrane protein YraQ (UPF0718 family)